jgi:hypothetical protein
MGIILCSSTSEGFFYSQRKAGWRGAGLIPFTIVRILRSFPEVDNSEINSQQSEVIESADISFTKYLAIESPIKSGTLHSIHAKIDYQLNANTLDSPIKKTIAKLNHQHEVLLAEYILLRCQFNAVIEVV